MASMANDTNARIRETILQNMPREAEITRIEFEGPRLAVYVRNIDLLLEQGHIITDIVNIIHKRIVMRSDPSIRLPEEEARNEILKLIPPEAGISSMSFDSNLGEVLIEVKKPGIAIGKDGIIIQEIIRATKWRPIVLRAPPMPSKIISSVRNILRTEFEQRSRMLRDVGERIFRPTLSKPNEVLMIALGSFHEVGRSAILIRAGESVVLLDCGINPGSQNPSISYPRLDIDLLNLEELDAVIISHAHLDHCGMVPFLYKYGYEGPIYCSEPTAMLMPLLQLDYLEVLSKEGAFAPFDQRDVREALLHTIPLKYGVVTDVAPDIKLTLHNAGHILGSSIVHLHIGEGLHNIVYTGDFKYGTTVLLEQAVSTFPRVETLIMESTYGGPEDAMPEREEAEEKLISLVNETAERGGKVLIPSLAVGRAQEIMLVLDRHMKGGRLKELPIFVEGMVSEATAIHTAFPEYLSAELRERILHMDENPFESEYLHMITHPSQREEVISGGPCIIMATAGMLEGGPILDYFRRLASDPRNTLIFVSYQIEGTLGSRILKGAREVPMMGTYGTMEILKVGMRVEAVEGFSGHSDRRQLLNFVNRISPKPSKIIINHGERKKCDSLAQSISKLYKIRALAPDNMEVIRLR
ncbi:MAG: beta-CASP ribonuclease aCPSF1 [Candidatus Bathyarchaeia archaeon]